MIRWLLTPVLAAICFLPALPAPEQQKRPPNLVIVLADDMGFGDPDVLQPAVEDCHAVYRQAGRAGHAVHRHALAVGGVQPDPVRAVDRTVLLAGPAQEERLLWLRPAAHRIRPADAGPAAQAI